MPTIAQVMTPEPATVSPETTLSDVIAIMRTNGFRQLVVVSGDQLLGIITDRDIRLAMNSPMMLHERADDEALLKGLTARSCMTPQPITVTSELSAGVAASLLREHKVGALPVVDEGRLVGIITVSDILRSYITLLETQAEHR